MQYPSTQRQLSPAVRVLLLVLAILAVTVIAAAVVPTALQVVGIAFALLVAFSICALPFAMVVGVVWLITRAARPHHPSMYAGPAQPGLGATPGPSEPGAVAATPAPVPASVGLRGGARISDPTSSLPAGLQAIVARLRNKAQTLHAPSQWHLLAPEDQLQVDRIIQEYLPEILAGYQAVPRGTHEWPVHEGGPSVVEIVEHQLRLLEESLDAIADRVFRVGAAQLLAQQEFLKQALGEPPTGELRLP